MSEVDYDPPITSTSHHTTLQASRELAELFRQKSINKIHIISSKFLRCLMTAEHVSKNLASDGFLIDQ